MKTSIYAAMTAAAMLAGLLTANDMSAGTVTAGNTGTGNAPAAVEKQEEGKVILLSEDEYKAMVEDFTTEEWKYEDFTTEEWKYLGDRPAIVDFYADWCGPCRQMSPVLEKIASDYKGKINVYKVNVDNARNLSKSYGIRSIPMFLLIPVEGEPVKTVGSMPEEQFRAKVKDALL